MDPAVSAFLAHHSTEAHVLENGRIKCLVTGHELCPRLEDLEGHWTGARFRKAQQWYSHDFSQYAPYLVPAKDGSKRLYCTLTHRFVNMIPDEVRLHLEGRRFRAAKQRSESNMEDKSAATEDEEDSGQVEEKEDDVEFLQDLGYDVVKSEEESSSEDYCVVKKSKKNKKRGKTKGKEVAEKAVMAFQEREEKGTKKRTGQ